LKKSMQTMLKESDTPDDAKLSALSEKLKHMEKTYRSL